jgi:hypothetical protein
VEFLIVCIAALLASALTLFSGFGLGTLLMPVVALFFPLELAIAMTAMVHLANNLFKIGLLGRKADGSVLLKFGLPAIAAAFAGAALLTYLGAINPIYEYQAFGRARQVSVLKLVIGVLIVSFVILELSQPSRRRRLIANGFRLAASSAGSLVGSPAIKEPFEVCS